MRFEAILPFWTGLLSPSRLQPAYPLRNSRQQPIHSHGAGKLDHEPIDNAVVTGHAGDGPRRFEFGHRNSLEECGPLNR
jgi:hypothetical protein